MKLSEILKLSQEEFENLLTDETFNWCQDNYDYMWQALEMYQEGAKSSGEDEYLEVNEYFNLIREQKELYND